MFRMILAGIAAVVLQGAAQARDVQLIAFGAAPPSKDQRPTSQSLPLETILAEGFGGLSRPADPVPASPDVPAADAIAVPLWMKTGVTRFAGRQSRLPAPVFPRATPVSFVAAEEGACGAVYRPRPDLPSSTEARRARLFPLIAQVACEVGLPFGLFDALVAQESRYQVFAVSPKGAAGLTQLMPGTARLLGVYNSFDAMTNLRGGARYLRQQLDEFGRVDLALAAYNAGPGHVRRRGGVPPFRETLNYVVQITRAWRGSFPRSAAVLRGSDQMGAVYAAHSPFRRVDLMSYTSPSTPNPM